MMRPRAQTPGDRLLAPGRALAVTRLGGEPTRPTNTATRGLRNDPDHH